MKLRKPLPLLLLLSPTLISAQLQQAPPTDDPNALNNAQILALNHAPTVQKNSQSRTEVPLEAGAALNADSKKQTSAQTTSNPYKGTEDAPVDGMDGKPHAGPFVDTTPPKPKGDTAGAEGGEAAEGAATAKAVPTSLKKFGQGGASDAEGWKLEDIPERNDGVMNDEGRPVPKKGTTGTEGGVSEKEKARLAKGPGPEEGKKPQGPDEAPPLPVAEQEAIEAQKGSVKEDGEARKAGAGEQTDKGGKKVGGGEYGAGGYGMEKPTDLPEKPHNIPYTDSTRSTDGSDGPPVKAGKESWLQDTLPYTEGEQPAPSNPDGSPAASSADWHEWFHSFGLSFTMILFSEIGDKTFLVAALMAMRHPCLLVFSAAFGALIVMTVLSAVLGHAVPTLLPKKFTALAAALLFLVFGAKMLREGLAMDKDAGVGEEMREVEAELEEKDHLARRRSSHNTTDPYALESGRGRRHSSLKHGDSAPPPPLSRSPSPSKAGMGMGGLMNLAGLIMSPAWVQTFVMTFLGEWGDRSQIATIAMAAGQDYWLVTLGACAGHAVCTGVAVIGGRALAGRVSMRVVTIGGALAFLAFGIIYLIECLYE